MWSETAKSLPECKAVLMRQCSNALNQESAARGFE